MIMNYAYFCAAVAITTSSALIGKSSSFVLKQQPSRHCHQCIGSSRQQQQQQQGLSMSSSSTLPSPPAVPVDKVVVLEDAEAVGKFFCSSIIKID